VAVLSTGVNYRLPQLQDKIDLSLSGTGLYPEDNWGADVASMTGNPMDAMGIGTSVAALIASSEYGVAPGVKIIPVKVTDDIGASDHNIIARGFDYAIARGANIIYLDVGGGALGEEDCAPILLAEQKNILVVVPAGNGGGEIGSDIFASGCNTDGLLTVAASDDQQNLAYFSSWNPDLIHIAAPGIKVPTLSRDGINTTVSGGSISSALVAGVAALVLSNHPDYSALNVKKALLRSVTHSDSLAGKVQSAGILNAYRALITKVN
jgi:subtilisin family serine protease